MRDILGKLQDGEGPDPMRSARAAMRPQLPKRFYKAAEAAEADGAHVVLLDGRAALTPGRNRIELPSLRAANLVADEFAAQADVIDPATMPVLRLVNTAIDGVSREPDAVKEDVLRFAASDLLCYRAEAPEALAERQRAAWDPPLEWVEKRLGSRFELAAGVMHIPQPKATIAAFRAAIDPIADPFLIAALHSMTSLTGSAILALGVLLGGIDADQAWRAAHVDEDWNIDQWGSDAEASERRAARWREMQAAAGIVDAIGTR